MRKQTVSSRFLYIAIRCVLSFLPIPSLFDVRLNHVSATRLNGLFSLLTQVLNRLWCVSGGRWTGFGGGGGGGASCEIDSDHNKNIKVQKQNDIGFARFARRE